MSTFQLTVGSNYVIAISMLGEAIGFKMTRQFSQLMRSKAKTNCTLNALFFPRFEQVITMILIGLSRCSFLLCLAKVITLVMVFRQSKTAL